MHAMRVQGTTQPLLVCFLVTFSFALITDAREIEKLTWIRGADRVVIGPETTEIEWFMWNTLVIPRLRLSKEEPATATVSATDVPVLIDKELAIDVMQCGDGRILGGIRIENAGGIRIH